MYSARAPLPEAVTTVASEQGSTEGQIGDLPALLPDELKAAPAFFDKMTDRWRYEYGEAYTELPGAKSAYGTDQCPSVRHLVKGVLAAMQHLTGEELEKIANRLRDKSRHEEALAELAPLPRLRRRVGCG